MAIILSENKRKRIVVEDWPQSEEVNALWKIPKEEQMMRMIQQDSI